MATKISKEEAHDIVDKAETGFLLVYGIEPKRIIGTVPMQERELAIDIKSYRFEEEK